MSRPVMEIYLGHDGAEVFQLQTDRLGRMKAESLSGVTRIVLSIRDPATDIEVAAVDSDVAPTAIDYSEGTGTGDIVFILGDYVATLEDADGDALVPAGRYSGRLLVYGVLAGRTYTDGDVWINDILVNVHPAT